MTIFFPDLSQYNQANIEPDTVAVIARATLSTSVADGRYTTFKQQAAQVGALFAAYHWLNHGNITAQAAWAWRHVGSDTPLMIDAEDMPGNSGYAGPCTVTDIINFAQAYREFGGTVQLAYLPNWYWSQQLTRPDLTPLARNGLALVSSSYTTYSETGPGWQPYGGADPVIWQYTNRQPYGGTVVDFNAYRGTTAQLRTLLTGHVMAFTDEQYPAGYQKDPDGQVRRPWQHIRDTNLAVNFGLPETWLGRTLAGVVADIAELKAGPPIELTDEQVALLGETIAQTLPTAGDVAKALADEIARRFTT